MDGYSGCKAVTENLKPFQSTTFGNYFIARTGYTGEDGFEITLPADQAADFWQKLHAAGWPRPGWVRAIPCVWKQA